MREVNSFSFEPVSKKWEVFRDFIPNEDSIDHMAAKQAHFYFIP